MTKFDRSSPALDLPAALSDLATADRKTLVGLWLKLVGRPVPANLSVPFLRRALAFEMQCAALGASKARSITDLQRIAAGRSSAASVGGRLQPGARLIREWQGRTWTVEFTEAGFVMAGERFASLSAIAQRITGAHWSGPRFFGLKAGTGTAAGAAQQRSSGATAPARSTPPAATSQLEVA